MVAPLVVVIGSISRGYYIATRFICVLFCVDVRAYCCGAPYVKWLFNCYFLHICVMLFGQVKCVGGEKERETFGWKK